MRHMMSVLVVLAAIAVLSILPADGLLYASSWKTTLPVQHYIDQGTKLLLVNNTYLIPRTNESFTAFSVDAEGQAMAWSPIVGPCAQYWGLVPSGLNVVSGTALLCVNRTHANSIGTIAAGLPLLSSVQLSGDSISAFDVTGGDLIVATDSTIYRIDLVGQTVKWSVPFTNFNPEALNVIWAVKVIQNIVVVPYISPIGVIGLDATNGQLVWSTTLDGYATAMFNVNPVTVVQVGSNTLVMRCRDKLFFYNFPSGSSDVTLIASPTFLRPNERVPLPCRHG